MKKLKQLLLILVLSLSLTSPAVIPAMGTTTVSAATVRKPSLSNSKLTIYTGKSVLLKVNGTSGKVKWISQNKRIVTVDSKGKVTARGVGKTIISIKNLVKVNESGKKYHRIPNCGNMNPNRAHKVTLSQAKQRGYTACKNCYR